MSARSESTSQQNQDFEILVSLAADDLLTEDQEMMLAEHLENDPDAQRYYLDYLSLGADLEWDYAEAAVRSAQPRSEEPAIQ
ncbi:MAG: hypothetical protein AAF357_14375, partial [Verrucomicrobiota bacterium]